MKECNVNYMKLFKSDEKEITIKMDIKLDINEQCPAQLMLLFCIILGQKREVQLNLLYKLVFVFFAP